MTISGSQFAKLMIEKEFIKEQDILGLTDNTAPPLTDANTILTKFGGKIYKTQSEIKGTVVYTLGYHGKYIPLEEPRAVVKFYKDIANKLITKIKDYAEEYSESTLKRTNLECKLNEHDCLRDYKGSATNAEILLKDWIKLGYFELKAGYIYLGPTSKYNLTTFLQPFMKTCCISGEKLIYYKYCCGTYYHPMTECSSCSQIE